MSETGADPVPQASESNETAEATVPLLDKMPEEPKEDTPVEAPPNEPPADDAKKVESKIEEKVRESATTGNLPIASSDEPSVPTASESFGGDEEDGEIKADGKSEPEDPPKKVDESENAMTATSGTPKSEETKSTEEESGFKSVESGEVIEEVEEKQLDKVVEHEALKEDGDVKQDDTVNMDVEGEENDGNVMEDQKAEEIAKEEKQVNPIEEEKDDSRVEEEDKEVEQEDGNEVVEEEDKEESVLEEEKQDDAMVGVKQESALEEEKPEKTTLPLQAEPQSEEAESSSKAELPYSTRGRATTGAEPNAMGDLWERSSRDGFDDIGRAEKPTTAALGTSFLESLSEEERRTRTRFLPDVEGMHTLRKHEVKGDLALARSIASGGGVTSLGPSRKKVGKRSNSIEDGMEIEEDEDTPPSEDDRGAELGTSTFEIGKRSLTLPSNAFVPPPGDASDVRDGQRRGELLSPLLIESVTAFDPPRPAESVGAKKKHRMLRWERRPEDLEVDLSNYRKTVQRTRQELHKAEAECERLETIDSHLRRHFLGHLDSLTEEYFRLNEELGRVQQDCVSAADLLTSRTRSRGAGKGSYVMRDVLAVLKARGSEMKEKGVTIEEPVPESSPRSGGIGGLSSFAFEDWVESSVLSPKKPASSWLLPGDKVQTPCGKGTVVDVYSFSKLSDSHSPLDTSVDSMSPATTQRVSKSGDTEKSLTKKKTETSGTKGSAAFSTVDGDAAKQEIDRNPTLPPRVSVKLPFGIGYFNIGSVYPIEDISFYSDPQLARRWQHMAATASVVGHCLDVEGMAYVSESQGRVKSDSDDEDNDESSAMDVDDEHGPRMEAPHADGNSGGADGAKTATRRFLPFGAGLLPSAAGRGNFLHDLPVTDIEKEIHDALFDGEGVLGKVCSSCCRILDCLLHYNM